MSYAFDVMSSVFSQHIRPHIPDDEVAMWFGNLIETMHNANHECTLHGSALKGDGVNKHSGVTSDARRLDEAVKKLKEQAEVRIAESAASAGEKIAAQTGLPIEIVPDEPQEGPTPLEQYRSFLNEADIPYDELNPYDASNTCDERVEILVGEFRLHDTIRWSGYSGFSFTFDKSTGEIVGVGASE